MSVEKRYFDPLTEKQLKAIRNEFNVTDESLKNDVKHLIEWFEKQPHLPNITDEEWLTQFLLRCKNSVERAKQQLDYYFVCRAMMPDIFAGRERIFASVLRTADKFLLLPWPKLTTDGMRIITFNILQTDNVETTGEILLSGIQMVIEVILQTDQSVQFVLVMDLANLTLPLMALLFPILKKMLFLSMKMLPLRYHKIYVLNVLPAVESFVQFVVGLLSKKMANRVEIWHESPAELATKISPEALPKCYGGKLEFESVRKQWLEYLAEQKDFLVSAESLKADLSKKPSDIKGCDQMGEYGVEGTFRKINLD